MLQESETLTLPSPKGRGDSFSWWKKGFFGIYIANFIFETSSKTPNEIRATLNSITSVRFAPLTLGEGTVRLMQQEIGGHDLSVAILDVRLQKFAYRGRCHGADLSGYFQAIFK